MSGGYLRYLDLTIDVIAPPPIPGPDDPWDPWADAPWNMIETVTMTDPAGNIIGLPMSPTAPDLLLRQPIYPLTAAIFADLSFLRPDLLDQPQPYANRAARRRAARGQR